MTDPEQALAGLADAALVDHVVGQRWFGSKSQEVTQAEIIDKALLRTTEPLLAWALVELRFQPGTHELYQLPLGLRPAAEGWREGVIAEVGSRTVYDALADPTLARELVHLVRGGATLATGEGTISFQAVEGVPGLAAGLTVVRAIETEQSNSSVVFDEELILKVFRRLEAGINPELEILRFLTERGYPNIAALAGFFSYSGRPMDATLGIAQEFVRDGLDVWGLALDELGHAPERFLGRLRRLGEVTGTLHAALASDSSDPSFAPEEMSSEALALLTATVDEEIAQIFLELPDGEAFEPIAGRGEEVREHLSALSRTGGAGRVIRHHGDFHLGQTLWADGDWVILDFEGEPARSLPERRRKRSPLRDVAGMMRSFAYAASAARILREVEPPEDWEDRAREEFLTGYLETVDQSLLPPGRQAVERLLSVFELEKAVYELRYEIDNRPEWVGIPVAGILRLLEQPLVA